MDLHGNASDIYADILIRLKYAKGNLCGMLNSKQECPGILLFHSDSRLFFAIAMTWNLLLQY